jgi:hypothetical protein
MNLPATEKVARKIALGWLSCKQSLYYVLYSGHKQKIILPADKNYPSRKKTYSAANKKRILPADKSCRKWLIVLAKKLWNERLVV